MAESENAPDALVERLKHLQEDAEVLGPDEVTEVLESQDMSYDHAMRSRRVNN